MEDPRAAVPPVLAAFAEALEGCARGLYVGGSLPSGDHHPLASDVDAAALIDRSVDLGLTVVARADATIRHGGLIPKTDAIEWLRTQDLPARIVDGMAARRAGETPQLGAEDRQERATVVRSFLQREIARLVEPIEAVTPPFDDVPAFEGPSVRSRRLTPLLRRRIAVDRPLLPGEWRTLSGC